jgi:tRNA(Ile)-lysidine synthase
VEYLEWLAADLYQRALEPMESKLDRVLLRSAPLALQRRVIRRFLAQTLGQMPRYHQIEATIALIDAPNRTRTSSFRQGLAAEVAGQWIVVRGDG